MKLLFLSNVFPNPLQPLKGVFNLELARALARDHELRVVSPVAWVDAWRAWNCKPARGQEVLNRIDGIEVHYPRYYYPPKVLRSWYAWFLWESVRRTVRRLL